MWVREESVMLLLLVHQSDVLLLHQTHPGVATYTLVTCYIAAASASLSHSTSVMVQLLNQVLLLLFIKIANDAISLIITDSTQFQLQRVSPTCPQARSSILPNQKEKKTWQLGLSQNRSGRKCKYLMVLALGWVTLRLWYSTNSNQNLLVNHICSEDS